MIVRYRWFQPGLSSEFGEFIASLISHPLTNDSSFGFILLEDSPESTKFKFIWKTVIVATQFDNEGAPESRQTETINFMDIVFLSRAEKTYLRIENPGLSSRKLMNASESFVSIGFYQKPIVFNHQRLLFLFQ